MYNYKRSLHEKHIFIICVTHVIPLHIVIVTYSTWYNDLTDGLKQVTKSNEDEQLSQSVD